MVPCPLLPHYRFNTLVSLRWAMAASEYWIFKSLIPSYPLSLSVPIESRKPSMQTLDRPLLLLVAQTDASLPAVWGEMQVIPLNIQIASLSWTGPGSPTSVVVEGPPRCITGLPRNENRGNRGLRCWTLEYAPDSRMSNSRSFLSIPLKPFIFLPRCRL